LIIWGTGTFITPLTEEKLEDFLLENSPKARKMIAEAEKDIQAGKTVKLNDYPSPPYASINGALFPPHNLPEDN
jgi:hypothetical protein